MQIVSGTFNAGSGLVVLQTDGEIAVFDDGPAAAWSARFGNRERIVQYVQGGGYEVQLDTTQGDPDVGPDECTYMAVPPSIVDVDGLPLSAQGPISLTAA